MRKVPLVAVFWVFALAIPTTIIALAGVAYINLHFGAIVRAILNLEILTTAGGRGWLEETGQRLPELAGMIVGMAVMYAIYLFTRNGNFQQIVVIHFEDTPRRLGKGWVRLVGSALLSFSRKAGARRQYSPVPLAAFARRQQRENRNCAARSD